jgi:hypothetical protein
MQNLSFWFIYLFISVLGIEPRVLGPLGKYHLRYAPSPFIFILLLR